MKMKETHNYDNIIHLSHPSPSRRAPMSNYDRAAQFSPFAALTGFEAAIQETARLTEEPIAWDEGGKAILDEKLREIVSVLHTRPKVKVTYFLPDGRKAGGAYVCAEGRVKRFEEHSNTLLLTDGKAIPISAISEIQME